MSGNTETDFFLGALFDFDDNNLSHSGGKCEEETLVSRQIMASLPAHLLPDNWQAGQRSRFQESFASTCFWPLFCNQHHVLKEGRYASCFLPPSFSPFLLFLLLFFLGGWSTRGFLVPGRDDITCSRYSCPAAGPRGGRWAAGSSTGIPAEGKRKRHCVGSQPPARQVLVQGADTEKQQLPH